MSDALTSTGFSLDSLETRTANVLAALRAAIHPNLDLSPDQPAGQIARIHAEREQALGELIRNLYQAWDPRSATGASLTALAALTGTYRHAATKGDVALTLTLGAAVTVPAGSVVAVSGNPANRWVIDADVTSIGAGAYPATATAESPGAIQALVGTITVIATPVAGWSAVTNAADAVPGQAEESDHDLRARRESELFAGGSTSVDAIRAALLALADQGMISATVVDNDLDVASGGLPPHSFEAITWDGSPVGGPYVVPAADIAEAIFEAKAAGIRAFGQTLVIHADSQGNTHAIRFTRVTPLRVLVEVTLTTGTGYVGAAAVKAAVAAWATAELEPGEDVYRSKVSAVVCDLAGVVDVSLVRLAIFPAALAAADLVVDLREIATIDAADVTVL